MAPKKFLPLSTLTAVEEARFLAKIDQRTDAECWPWTGSILSGVGYGRINVRRLGGVVYAHRLSYFRATGVDPAEHRVDHTCHNRACVNPAHLRLATQKQNAENINHLPANNRSGYLGVYWSRQARCFHAAVMHNGKRYHAGSFASASEAGEAARRKRLELFTHNSHDIGSLTILTA